MKIVKNTFVVEKKRIRHGLEKVASCSQKYILMAKFVGCCEGKRGLNMAEIVLTNGEYYIAIGNNNALSKTQDINEATRFISNEVARYVKASYVMEYKVVTLGKLFDVDMRTVRRHLIKACEKLGYRGIRTYHFRKLYYGIKCVQ